MPPGTVKTWFSRATGSPPLLEAGLAEAIGQLPDIDALPILQDKASAAWPADRLAVAELLWGAGYVRPGGASEVVRLGQPLADTSWASVLLLGAGPGGAAQTIATELGLGVTGFEADPALAAIAVERLRASAVGRRAEAKTWDPWQPGFGAGTFHHAICLEPLRGAPAVPVLTACAKALRPAGQIVLTELVADQPLDPHDPAVAGWVQREPARGIALPSEREVTRALTRLGFDVRAAEDITAAHVHLCLRGWRLLVGELRGESLALPRAYWMVQEAELWLNRVKLMRQGKLRLVRWHATGRLRSVLSALSRPD